MEYAPRMFRDESPFLVLFLLLLERYYPYLDSFVYFSVSSDTSFLLSLRSFISCEFARLIFVLRLIGRFRIDLSFLIRFNITGDRFNFGDRVCYFHWLENFAKFWNSYISTFSPFVAIFETIEESIAVRNN